MSGAKWYTHNAVSYAGVGIDVEADMIQISFNIDEKSGIIDREKDQNVMNVQMTRALAEIYLESLQAALRHQE